MCYEIVDCICKGSPSVRCPYTDAAFLPEFNELLILTEIGACLGVTSAAIVVGEWCFSYTKNCSSLRHFVNFHVTVDGKSRDHDASEAINGRAPKGGTEMVVLSFCQVAASSLLIFLT
jgi:hypothetical protein